MKEFLSKNKYLIIAAAVVAIVLGGWLMGSRCEEATQEDIEISSYMCALEVMTDGDLRNKFCNHLKRGNECDLSEDDRSAYESYIDNRVTSCAEEILKSNGMCSGGVKQYIKGLR